MGLVSGLVGFVLGLPLGLAAACLVYLRFFAPRRRPQVTTPFALPRSILSVVPSPDLPISKL